MSELLKPPLAFIIFLFIAPLLSTFVTSLLVRFTKKEIPPFMLQLNGYSFGQTIVILVAVLSYQGLSPAVGIVTFSVFLVIIFLLLMQTSIDQSKKDKTEEHISNILKAKVQRYLKQEFELEKVKDIAYSLIDEDYFPESWTQKFSGYPRRKRREKFTDLVNNYFCRELPQPLRQDDLLVLEQDRKKLKILYFIVNSSSFLVYVITIILVILVSR